MTLDLRKVEPEILERLMFRRLINQNATRITSVKLKYVSKTCFSCTVSFEVWEDEEMHMCVDRLFINEINYLLEAKVLRIDGGHVLYNSKYLS